MPPINNASRNSYYEKMADGTVKCIDEEIPFEIPVNWALARLYSICELIEDCPHSTAKDEGDGFPLIRTSNIGFGVLNFANVHRVCKETYDKRNQRAVPKVSDLIFAREAPAGNIAVIREGENVCLGQRTVLVRPLTNYINPYYLAYYILNPISQKNLVDNSTGTTVSHVNLSDFRPYIIALPPLAEQERIVRQIDKVLPLIDRFNQGQQTLEKLNKEIKNKIKLSLLQEAIQGKLVPQIAEEGDASELLKQIEQEKQKLVKEGKLKKKDLVSSTIFRGDDNKYYENVNGKTECIDDEIPFDIPESWRWCRIGVVSQSYIGLTYQPSEVNSNGTIVLRSSNIQNGKLDLNDIVRVNTPIADKLWVEKNDILICARNGSKKLVGKSAVIEKFNEPMTFGAFMAICKTRIFKYVYLFLQSDCFFSQLRGVSGTTTINQLTQNNFNRFLIPIPPLQEQERIVTKLSDLMNRM